MKSWSLGSSGLHPATVKPICTWEKGPPVFKLCTVPQFFKDIKNCCARKSPEAWNTTPWAGNTTPRAQRTPRTWAGSWVGNRGGNAGFSYDTTDFKYFMSCVCSASFSIVCGQAHIENQDYNFTNHRRFRDLFSRHFCCLFRTARMSSRKDFFSSLWNHAVWIALVCSLQPLNQSVLEKRGLLCSNGLVYCSAILQRHR